MNYNLFLGSNIFQVLEQVSPPRAAHVVTECVKVCKIILYLYQFRFLRGNFFRIGMKLNGAPVNKGNFVTHSSKTPFSLNMHFVAGVSF